MQSQHTTLILAPHITDEIVGCFSFLSQSAHVMWFGLEQFQGQSRDEHLAEAETTAKATGFDYTLLDEKVNAYREEKLVWPIEEKIRELHPETILLPRPGYNRDHKAVFEAGIAACRPQSPHNFVKRVLIYDQIHATTWPRDQFEANFFKPIDLDAKLRTWRLQRSTGAMAEEEHFRTLAGFRGRQAGVNFAEAFHVLRWVA